MKFSCLTVLVLLLIGCTPPKDNSIDNAIDKLADSSDRLLKSNKLLRDTADLAVDCMRVDAQTWKANDCARRKAALDKRADDLQNETDEEKQ